MRERVKPRSISTPMDEATASFASGLRWWRERRGFSQLDLAGAAETTQRHLSFLESGRARPSPEMILRLATVLDIPLRQQNALLLAAGFAPAWRESDLSAPELAQVNGVPGVRRGPALESRARQCRRGAIRRVPHWARPGDCGRFRGASEPRGRAGVA
jgi:transcriptional regulator with XRE-family HTH domain